MPQTLKVKPEEVQSIKVAPGQVSAYNQPVDNPEPEPEPSWWMDAAKTLGVPFANLGIGAAKRVSKIAGSPGVPGDLPFMLRTALETQPERFEPEGTAQWLGDIGTELASYLLPAGVEAKAGNVVQNALRSGLSGGRVGRMTGGLLDAASRSAIGGASSAISANANREDPLLPTILGAAIPGGAALARNTGFSKWLGDKLIDKGRNAYIRAIQPGTRVNKFVAEKVVDPLLEAKRVFFGGKGLAKIGREEVDKALADRAKERAAMGLDPVVPYDEAVQVIRDHRDKVFRSGKTGTGDPMGNIQEEVAADSEVENWIANYLLPKSKLDAAGNRVIPFDELDISKRAVQNEAGKRNMYVDLPTDPIASSRMEAYKEIGNATRPYLETKAEQMGAPGWAEANKRISANLDIERLGREKLGKELGAKQPWAEHPLIGMGAGLGESVSPQREARGMILRSLRGLWNSPIFASTEGVNLFKAGKAIQSPSAAQKIGKFSAGIAGRGGVYNLPPEEGQPMDIKVDVPQAASQPAPPQTEGIPPDVISRMKPGVITTFANGTSWILKEDGTVSRVK